jgi:hypothetical protein
MIRIEGIPIVAARLEEAQKTKARSNAAASLNEILNASEQKRRSDGWPTNSALRQLAGALVWTGEEERLTIKERV